MKVLFAWSYRKDRKNIWLGKDRDWRRAYAKVRRSNGNGEKMPLGHESCELLRAIARPLTDADQQRTCQLAKRVNNWDEVFSLAQEHRVLPMLFLCLEDVNACLPPDAQERLRAEYRGNAFRILANSAELIKILKAFDREGIPAMPFKGVVLGASVYSDPMARPAGDLDVLIHYRDLLRATTILLDDGFELTTPTHEDKTPSVPDYYEYHFERQTDGMVVELRWRLDLVYGKFRRDLGMNWVWPRRQDVNLAGAKVPNINPETTLLVLCMHGSKHVWSRLIWICDVAQLLVTFPDLDWKTVTREAKQLGLWRALALGVLLARLVAHAAVPRAILGRFEADAPALKLAHYIEQNLFDMPGSTPSDRVPYNIRLLGFHDRAREMLSLELLKPNERDRAILQLPRSLHALYYLIRPFRLLMDKSAR